MTGQAIDHGQLEFKGYPKASHSHYSLRLCTWVHICPTPSVSLQLWHPWLRRKKGELGTEITYLVVFPFLMAFALHLWGGFPVDLVRGKGQIAMLTSISTTQRIKQCCSRVQGKLK